MNKNSILKFLTVFVLACISMFGISCKENEKPGPNKDFVISNDRVPTAYVKAEYNLEQLLVKEEGVSYSVYSLKYTSETEQIGYEGFLFTPVKDPACRFAAGGLRCSRYDSVRKTVCLLGSSSAVPV